MKRILIADDDPISLRLLQRTLTQLGYEVVAATDGTAAIAALLDPEGPRLAILDWMMPGADGLAVCRAIRQRTSPYVYAILLTARDSRDDMFEGLEAGADDFLTKPLHVVELRARLRSGTRVLELQEGLLAAHDQLRVLARHDHLTGLLNRGAILEHLDRELERARRERRPLALCVADLDKFKQINDTYGHAAGDAVLKHAAAQLSSSVRTYDFVGRYGGEEFLIVLPGCAAAAARAVVERVCNRLAATPAQFGDTLIPVTISMGLNWTVPEGARAETLISAADEALYQAKAQGRNRVVEWCQAP